MYVWPEPTPEDIVSQYERKSGTRHTRQGSRIGRSLRYRSRAMALRRRGLTGSILEVGCGQGDFLNAAKNAGFRGVFGVEPNKPVAEYARSRGFDVRGELFDPVSFGSQRFDTVASFQVLEHVVDPVGFITDAAKLVPVGGRIVVETPGTDHPRAMKAGTDWRYIMPPWHLNLFGTKSLETVFDRAGFGLESAWHHKRKMYITAVGVRR